MSRWILSWVCWGLACVAAAAGPAAPAPTLGCLIEPDKVADLGSSVIGVLDSVRVERGDMVKKGQDLRGAEANRVLAQQKLRRAEELVAKKFLAQQALDQAQGDYQVADQKVLQIREQLRVWGRELSVAEAQVGLRTIRSPFDGVVAERYLSLGERVEEKPVFKIAKIDPLRVEVIVPSSRFGTIRVGEVASVKPDLPNAVPVDATVALVDRVIDAASNTFRVRLSLPNPDLRLPAGLRCRIAFGGHALGHKSAGVQRQASSLRGRA